jgi:hypothetical protein
MNRAEHTLENLEKIKRIERTAYAGTEYCQMQWCTSWQDIAGYCQCPLSEVHILLSDTGYVIAATHRDKGYAEIVDLASTDRRMNLHEVWDFLLELKLPFTLDARESTSYRMIKALEKKGEITIAASSSYLWEGETFYELKVIPAGVKLTEEAMLLFGQNR